MSNVTRTYNPGIIWYCDICGREHRKHTKRVYNYCHDSENGLSPCQKKGQQLKARQKRARKNGGKTCISCKQSFQAKKTTQRYCSNACKMRIYRILHKEDLPKCEFLSSNGNTINSQTFKQSEQ